METARPPHLTGADKAVGAKEVADALLAALAVLMQRALKPNTERKDEVLLVPPSADRGRGQVSHAFQQQALQTPAVLLDRIRQSARHLHQLIEQREKGISAMTNNLLSSALSLT